MCGRFTLTKVDQLPSFFGLDEQPEVDARYNIAPRQDVLVVLHNKPRIAKFMRWGFSPNLTARSRCSLLINARAETVDRKVTFGYPFRTQRCLVPADGFYEWSSGHSSRKPFYFHLANRGLFAFAGPPAQPILANEPTTNMVIAIKLASVEVLRPGFL